MVKRSTNKTPVVIALLVVLVAVIALSYQMGLFNVPEPKTSADEGVYKEVSEPGHEDKPFIESPEGDKIVPKESVPVVRFFNQTSEPKNISIPLNYRIKFVNEEDETYTLQIPFIGINMELASGEDFEPSFYKPGNCTFWLEGLNETEGNISVG